MQAHIVKGRIAGIPYSKNVVDIATADVTQVIDSATGLVKTVGGIVLVGAGVLAGIGVISAILYALMSGVKSAAQTSRTPATPPQPRLPLGCSPVWIEVPESSFWGIILNTTFGFSTEAGNDLRVNLTEVSELRARVDREVRIQLVDGSKYNSIMPEDNSLDVATIGGRQSIKLHSGWSGAKEANFVPSRVSDVAALKSNLQQALAQNGSTITQLIGPNILQTYFNVPQIGA